MDQQFLVNFIPPHILTGLKDLKFELDSQSKNPRLCQILSETVLAGGKRIRPLLTLLMGDFFGLHQGQIAPYALDIERIHAATLAHDDVVDSAQERRGMPSINVVSSNKKAILAGDYLLAQVFYEVAERGDNRIVRELSRVIADLAEGEWLQIENTTAPQLRWADIEQVARKKTASVMRWCCAAPSMIAGTSLEVSDLCAELGECIGIAFQWGDDILDFEREDDQRLADLKNGVVSSVIFEALAGEHESVDMRFAEQLSLDDLEVPRAIHRIRTRMLEQLDHAHAILEVIIRKSGGAHSDREVTTTAIRGIIDFLKCRV